MPWVNCRVPMLLRRDPPPPQPLPQLPQLLEQQPASEPRNTPKTPTIANKRRMGLSILGNDPRRASCAQRHHPWRLGAIARAGKICKSDPIIVPGRAGTLPFFVKPGKEGRLRTFAVVGKILKTIKVPKRPDLEGNVEWML
jgi:hypothetical protein